MKKKAKSIPKKTPRRAGGPDIHAQNLDVKVPARSSEILIRKNDDGTLSVLNLNDSRKFYRLQGIAAELWLLIDGKSSIGKIKVRIARKYDPPQKRFNKDVATFIKDLRKKKLLEFV